MKTLALLVGDAPTTNFVAIDISQQLNWMVLINRVKIWPTHKETLLLQRWG